MSERYLTILEVSQKQAYIFQSNKLRENVLNSAVIAWIMDADYLEETVGDQSMFNKRDNLVYSGGGHTVLEFPDKEQAIRFVKKITNVIKKDYPDIEIFAKTVSYEADKSPAENLKELTKALEKKKSERRAAFHQGSFGVEEIDTNTLKPMLYPNEKTNEMPKKEEQTDKHLMAEGFHRVSKFEELGGTKDQSNFIAVVHIDGNAMGKRVERLHQKLNEFGWEEYKEKLKTFSESIDNDFKAAYKEMSEHVADNIRNDKLKDLNIVEKKFPVRRIITAGDDICFVAEGRIGLECAVTFINKLSNRKNKVDGQGYAACAGVAIVHQKYPFYKAYELAEMLCSSAKKYGSALSSDGFGSDVSAIDWHIEFGELKDTLEEMRADYNDSDGISISGRPYIVKASHPIPDAENVRCYSAIRDTIGKLQKNEDCARGTFKELRNILKQGQNETTYYTQFHRIDGLIKQLGNDYKVLFDAIELLDTFIALE